MMACALLLALAIVSHDAEDEAEAGVSTSDLLRAVSGHPDAQAKADTTRNWLGLIGALVSDSLVNNGFGYGTIAVPVALFLWGWALFRKGDLRRTLVISNYLILGMVLCASSFGMLRLILTGDGPSRGWSGIVGDFLATVLVQLLGRLGGTILLLVLLLVTLVVAVDLDMRSTVERMRLGWLRFLDWVERRRAAWSTSRSASGARDAGGDEEADEPAARPARAPVTIARPSPEQPSEPRPAKPASTIAISMRKEAPAEKRAESKPAPASQQAAGQGAGPYVFPSADLLDPPGRRRRRSTRKS